MFEVVPSLRKVLSCGDMAVNQRPDDPSYSVCQTPPYQEVACKGSAAKLVFGLNWLCNYSVWSIGDLVWGPIRDQHVNRSANRRDTRERGKRRELR